ncbi:SMI1/KNR4 family protein [Deinococcus sp.]|uniref:SMI1/KNR4 family protein n=1 Tax=Deinococcus sp. TaxID=47478 RepID=UPI003C7B5109
MKLGVLFPPDLRASLLRHDGSENWTTGELLSLETIETEWKVWYTLLEDGPFDEAHAKVQTDGRVQKRWWARGWLPIACDGGGNGECLDLVPEARGVVGQVIYMDHEVGDRRVIAASFTDWLREQAEALEAGEYLEYHGELYTRDDAQDAAERDEMNSI